MGLQNRNENLGNIFFFSIRITLKIVEEQFIGVRNKIVSNLGLVFETSVNLRILRKLWHTHTSKFDGFKTGKKSIH